RFYFPQAGQTFASPNCIVVLLFTLKLSNPSAKEAAAGFDFRSGLFNITSPTLCAPMVRMAGTGVTGAVIGHRP
ncbi:hypothetical protein, partial [Klebsiella pneumoniae]